MKRHEGFGVVEVILMIFLFAAIAFSSWYIWQSNTMEQAPTSPSSTESESPLSQTVYSNKELGLSFKYPKDWMLKDEGASKDAGGWDIVLYSPDFSEEIGIDGISTISAGSHFGVSVGPNNSEYGKNANDYITAYKANEAPYSSSMQAAVFGNKDAVAYDCGHHSPYFCVLFVKDSSLFLFDYGYPGTEDDFRLNKQQNMSEFTQLLESVELED